MSRLFYLVMPLEVAMRPVEKLARTSAKARSMCTNEWLAVVFDVALKLVQAVFELGIIQRLHNNRTRLGHPEALPGIQDIIFKVIFLGDPKGTIQAADHI